MGAKLTQKKIFLKNPHLVALRSNQLKVKMKEDGETRIAMDSTFYLGSKKRAMTGQLLRLAPVGVNTRTRVFFLTAKNEWINWAIINYPIIASETLPYKFNLQEKKIEK